MTNVQASCSNYGLDLTLKGLEDMILSIGKKILDLREGWRQSQCLWT